MASDDFYADGQGSGEVSFRQSSHQFVEPIRLFKSNDPYYWEVDNVPLQQLQENVLWLKDQIAGDPSLDGVDRSEILELKPDAPGDSRLVTVRPGRFTGRVNDAFGTGISTLALKAAGTVEGIAYDQVEITTPDATIKSLAGAIATNILADNGLYDLVQHNVTAPAGLFNLNWTNTYTQFIQNRQDANGTIYDLQKNKLALWKQATTVRNYGGDPSSQVDLQQLAVEFTRVYGAPFRTAIVDVPSDLTIDIPAFDDSDYANHTTYVPAVRVDLLFVYTKPIDAQSTTILQPNGLAGTTLNSPQLGLVKGAGVISLNVKPDGSIWSGETLDEEFFNDSDYLNNKEEANLRFQPSGNFDSLGNRQTASIPSDLNQNTIGAANTFGNFPSPDDLMNAAPYITAGVSKSSLQMIGQSILPLAYIFTKKGKPTIERSDIFDIRPFFRTAELTYNERAGIAASNPPMSLANPAVSRYQLADTTEKLRTHVIESIPPPPEYPRPVGSGYVFGGIRFGPEGVLARMSADADNTKADKLQSINTNATAAQEEISQWLQDTGQFPRDQDQGSWQVPLLPDWEIAPWASIKGGAGDSRNDYFNFVYQQADRNSYQYTNDSNFDDAFTTGHVNKTNWSKYNKDGSMSFYVKKRVDIDKSNLTSDWMKDYHVRLSLVNCAPGSSETKFSNFSRDAEDQAVWQQFQGLYIEKYEDYFNIVCTWVVPDPFKGSGNNGPNGAPLGGIGGSPEFNRTTGRWSCVSVTSEDSRILQSTNKTAGMPNLTSANMVRNGFCTYPTVHFEIIGYPEGYAQNVKVDLQTNSVVQLTDT
jgi:hypothetical protein